MLYYIPLIGQNEVVSVLGIVLNKNERLQNSEKSLLTAMLNQISVAIEKYNLNEAQKTAFMQAENERFRANLLRAISHDLRTPLTGISGSANSILSNNFDEATKEKLIQDIYDDSLWLINLVENILSVSRLEGDKIKLHTEPQLVEEMISEALNHISRKANERSIKVQLEQDLLMINVDGQLIMQVIINIVDNAIKYTDAESEILISAYSKDKYAILKIADNGKGISDQNKNYVFDMFFTAQGNKGDSRRGLGLGLALCKSIVNAHGGEICVYDNKPQGTVFEFSLPLAEVRKNEKFNISG
jgi:two-component system sensor histidine kinase KdpD